MLLFKGVGLILIFSASAFLGFWKSFELRKRQNILYSICNSMQSLKEQIRLYSAEIERLINKSFDSEIISFKNNRLIISSNYLLKEDIAILEEFFLNIGMGDKTAECERADGYILLIKKQYEEAKEKSKELGKLYNTLGILCGIFICIFFL